ncbi:MAG: GTPase ObgE [Lachnospiraceae bacterium]|nr:GTPase ObgE [Lachnospiraceae bacterium]
MSGFQDTAKFTIISGKGGDGHVSFRREKFVAAGGPNGGDGGRGGDVIFKVDKGMNTLSEYRFRKKFRAGDGENGGINRRTGQNGENIVLRVPEGTVISETETGKIIADLSHGNTEAVVLRGGRGGKGNQHYATPTMQVPKYAQPGGEARELNVTLELKVIADVGLVGFPNVGKSTLLAHCTNATPKIANYHFTTISPNLGVVDLTGMDGFVIADIPGLIEGAAEGAGLGHEFLKHIERTKMMIHIVDAAGTEGRDPVEDIEAINKELSAFSESIIKKPYVIAANKMDCLPEEEREEVMEKLKKAYPDIKIFPISAVSGEGISDLLMQVNSMVRELPDVPDFEPDYVAPTGKRDLPYTVEYDSDAKEYVIEGPRIERMLGYTNLDDENGFQFFQKFLEDNGILEDLKALGAKDGDTVRMYGHSFDYYE